MGILITTGCSSGPSGSEVTSLDETAALEQVDTVEIQETDERFIGALADADIELDPLRIYVADRKMQRIAVITADGSIDHFIGEAGRGPGELGRPIFLSVDEDRVVVAQRRWRGFSVFDTSGTPIDDHRLPGEHYVGGYDLFQIRDGYVMPVTSFSPQRTGSLQVPSGENTVATLNDTFEVKETLERFPRCIGTGSTIHSSEPWTFGPTRSRRWGIGSSRTSNCMILPDRAIRIYKRCRSIILTFALPKRRHH